MKDLTWIEQIALSEQEFEESGNVNLEQSSLIDNLLKEETIELLKDLKVSFSAASEKFNNYKSSPISRVKIYGISQTEADFMLFRNGLKLIFSYHKKGEIKITLSHMQNSFLTGQSNANMSDSNDIFEESLVAVIGPFNQIQWTHKGKQFNIDHMIRFYLSQFLKESSQ